LVWMVHISMRTHFYLMTIALLKVSRKTLQDTPSILYHQKGVHNLQNQVWAFPQINQTTLLMGDEKGNYQCLTTNPCASLWFTLFMQDCKNWMGQDLRPNKAIITELLLMVWEKAEQRIAGAASSIREVHWWVLFHSHWLCPTLFLFEILRTFIRLGKTPLLLVGRWDIPWYHYHPPAKAKWRRNRRW
jgi:hypothetical protein